MSEVKRGVRYVILSVNESPEYRYHLPLVVWAWRRLGWEPFIFVNGGDLDDLIHKTTPHLQWNSLNVPEYKSETVAQISRLYAAICFYGEDYLMTSDADMCPLSDYWKDYKTDQITTWGWDLTEFQHAPICFIGMSGKGWKEVMNLDSNDYNDLIKRDLTYMALEYGLNDPIKVWTFDQELVTKNINASKLVKVNIHRGSGSNGYPIGRVDRSSWSTNHPQLIDCHMERGIWKDPMKMQRLMLLLTKVWPDENFDWFYRYTEEFKKLNP